MQCWRGPSEGRDRGRGQHLRDDLRRRTLSPNRFSKKKRSSSSKMKPIAIPSITVSCAPLRVAANAADPVIASAGIAIARPIHNKCITTAMHVVYRPQPPRRSFHSTTCARVQSSDMASSCMHVWRCESVTSAGVILCSVPTLSLSKNRARARKIAVATAWGEWQNRMHHEQRGTPTTGAPD